MINHKAKIGGFRTIWRLAFIALMVLIFVSDGFAQHRKGKRSRGRHHAHEVTGDEPAENSLKAGQLRLTLVDGSMMTFEGSHETEQGLWYERSGVTYLIPRERIKLIDRPQSTKPAAEPDPPSLAVAAAPERATATIGPVWIHLTSGARVEADRADESAAGVWYTRGSLAVFIERNRIERIEREDPESAAPVGATARERGWTTGNASIDLLIKLNGAKHGVDPYLIFCVMEQESHFSTRAVSPKGARGLMQLMPGTSARFGVRHPQNPGENISAGTRYLKQLIDQFNGRVDLVLASYNAGEGTVIRYGHKVPPYRETREYVRRISYRYHRPKPTNSPAVTATLGY